jgi:hypothetical protein
MKCINGDNICHLKYDKEFGTVNRFYICKIVISSSNYGKFNFGLYNTLIFGPASFDKCEIKMQQLCEKDDKNKYIILEYKEE